MYWATRVASWGATPIRVTAFRWRRLPAKATTCSVTIGTRARVMRSCWPNRGRWASMQPSAPWRGCRPGVSKPVITPYCSKRRWQWVYWGRWCRPPAAGRCIARPVSCSTRWANRYWQTISMCVKILTLSVAWEARPLTMRVYAPCHAMSFWPGCCRGTSCQHTLHASWACKPPVTPGVLIISS